MYCACYICQNNKPTKNDYLTTVSTYGFDYGLTSVFNKLLEEDDMSLVQKIKKLAMNKDDKELLKAGITNDCGELTSQGRDLVIETLFKHNKGEIVALAVELNLEKEKK